MARPPLYVSRSDLEWGSSPATRANPRSGLVIHYDSSNIGTSHMDLSNAISYWRRTRGFHTGPARGWVDVGYSFMASQGGYILEGRGLGRVQAAQPGGNSSHYSVTLACGPDDPITPEQINAVRALRAWLMDEHGVSGKVFGHRDFISTSCPGDKAYALVRNGTFEQPPGEITEVNDMLGLAIGSDGEAVKLLQLKVTRAGFGDALGAAGADGKYGDATAEAVRLCRAYVGSRALPGYGDKMTAHAVDQVEAAVTKRALAGLSSGGAGGPVDASDLVGKTVTSKITEVK